MFNHFLVCLVLVATASAVAAEQPRIGLVLAGGGARGIAHAGVIRALEEMQVPVHAIAGTSMGALVGGLYASGLDAEDLALVVEQMDWERAFQDGVDRSDQPQRRKEDDYDYPTQIKFSLKDGSVSMPLGFIQGQQVQQIIKELMRDVAEIRNFDELPIPYRAVATDIETGKAFVFDRGNVVTAMRASMSLPGLLAPVEHNGLLLIDGGIANNVPVSVARDMGVDLVIVVDIGTPLRDRDNINSVVAVADQMVGFLTRKNSEEQLAKLTDNDVLVSPQLVGIGMLDFDRADEIYRQGYDAARALEPQLAGLAVDDQAWEAYLAGRTVDGLTERPIDLIAVHNNSRVSDDIIRVRLSQAVGEPLDRAQLLDDIAQIYALNYWEIIDYDVSLEGSVNVLHINARERAWGDDRLKFGLNLVTDLDGASEFNLGTSYLWQGLNSLGGELYARGQLGDTIDISSEFYQPLDLRSRFFLVPYLGYSDYDVFTIGPEFDPADNLGNWRVREYKADLAAGVNLRRRTQVRLGVRQISGDYRIDAFGSEDLPEDDYREGSVYTSLRYDGMDSLFFPTEGGFLFAEYEAMREELGSDHSFERWQAFGQAAFSFGQDKANTVIVTARTGQSSGAASEPQNYFQLGGLFNVSGVPQNYFSARQMAFVMAQYQRRLSDNSVLPINLPVYAGFSVEGGQLWSDRSDVDFGDLVAAGSIYLGIDSPVGPLYVAYGHTEQNLSAIYLSLGWPFLTNQVRIGR